MKKIRWFFEKLEMRFWCSFFPESVKIENTTCPHCNTSIGEKMKRIRKKVIRFRKEQRNYGMFKPSINHIHCLGCKRMLDLSIQKNKLCVNEW